MGNVYVERIWSAYTLCLTYILVYVHDYAAIFVYNVYREDLSSFCIAFDVQLVHPVHTFGDQTSHIRHITCYTEHIH